MSESQSDYRSIWGELRETEFCQKYIDCKGIRTRALCSGREDMPPLLLLHGIGGHAEAYVRNLKAHGEHFNTWAIDLVGHGWTDKPDQDREIDDYVDHLLRFLDSRGFDRACISGESLGGWVATRLAVDHPDRVDRLVLNTAGGSKADPAVMHKLRSLSMQAAENPDWEFIRARVEWLMAEKDKAYDDLVSTRQAIYRQPGMARAMAHTMVLQDMTIRQRNLISDEQYRSIDVPTLVLWTSHDPTADVTEGRRIASLIPNALFTVMDGCGHWPQFEDPVTFNRIHISFLLGQDVPEASRAY